MSKFSKAPEITKEEEQVKNFINGASYNKSNPNNKKENSELPWTNLDDTEKTRSMNVRLTKMDLAKLQYISNNTPFSIQSFIYKHIRDAIENCIKDVI